jgi:hypothetical protein
LFVVIGLVVTDRWFAITAASTPITLNPRPDPALETLSFSNAIMLCVKLSVTFHAATASGEMVKVGGAPPVTWPTLPVRRIDQL